MDLARRLLMLTLALEEALGREAWSEVDSISIQRAHVLLKLAEAPVTAPAAQILKTVQAVEQRILGNLKDAQTSVAASIRNQFQGRLVATAYASVPIEARTLDRAG